MGRKGVRVGAWKGQQASGGKSGGRGLAKTAGRKRYERVVVRWRENFAASSRERLNYFLRNKNLWLVRRVKKFRI